MTALWLCAIAVAFAMGACMGWALCGELARAARLAMPDEADMTDASAAPFGPFAPLRGGDNPGRLFDCPAWPGCGCPDGAVRADCPGLRRPS